jgi:hypothetical protein
LQDCREKALEPLRAIGYFTRFLTRRTRRLLVCVILKLPIVKVPRSSWCFNFFLPHRFRRPISESGKLRHKPLFFGPRSTRAGRRSFRYTEITFRDASRVCQTSSSTCWTMTATRRRPVLPHSAAQIVCVGPWEGHDGINADSEQNCKAEN